MRPRAAHRRHGDPPGDSERAEAEAAPRRKRKHVWKDKHYRWVPDGEGGWRVQGYVVRHRHKPQGPPPRPGQEAARDRSARRRPAALADPEPPPPGAYQGPFGPAQATRLLNRAGFGAGPGQAEQLASLGLVGAVQSLTRPSGAADTARPGAGRRRRQPDGARRRLGPRPPLVARPHGAQRPAAGRADGARLPRLVRDLHRRRLQTAADDRPVEPLPLAPASAPSSTSSRR